MKITRTIKVSYFKARIWNDATEEMESRSYEFFDAMSDRDIERAIKAMLEQEDENLALVKVKKEGETVYKTAMELATYFKYAEKTVVELDDSNAQ